MRQIDQKDDQYKRTPLPWTGAPGAGFTSAPRPWMELAPGWETVNVAAQTDAPASLLSRYRRLIRARGASPALRLGDLTMIPTPPAVLAYVRGGGGETVLVAHNLGDAEAKVAISTLTGAAAEPLFADPGASLVKAGAAWQARLPPRSSAYWRVR